MEWLKNSKREASRNKICSPFTYINYLFLILSIPKMYEYALISNSKLSVCSTISRINLLIRFCSLIFLPPYIFALTCQSLPLYGNCCPKNSLLFIFGLYYCGHFYPPPPFMQHFKTIDSSVNTSTDTSIDTRILIVILIVELSFG